MRKEPGPFYEVWIARATWQRPFEALQRASIPAAKQLNRRALDNLYSRDVVAVGMFKVSVAPASWGPKWVCYIHLLISGTSKENIEKVFLTQRSLPGQHNTVWIKEVENLGQSIANVLSPRLREWGLPSSDPGELRPKNVQRTEYYSWLFRLPAGVRIVRYGCDRYFHKLSKEPRLYRPKIRKKRPYPVWLQPYMFGSHPMNCNCHRCSGDYPLS
jgi:hypothetical protein